MENPRVRINLLTDSRGRDIETRLLHEIGSSINCEITFNVYPGATLEKLKNRQTRGLADLTVIIGGICNFTNVHIEGQKRLVTYGLDARERQERKDLTKRTILDLLENQGNCIVSTIAPAKLTPCERPSLESEQQALLNDLQEINHFIKEESEKRNIKFLNLAKTFYRSSRKRRGKERKTVWRLAEETLPDGVHLNAELKDRWAKIIATCIKTSLNEAKT